MNCENRTIDEEGRLVPKNIECIQYLEDCIEEARKQTAAAMGLRGLKYTIKPIEPFMLREEHDRLIKELKEKIYKDVYNGTPWFHRCQHDVVAILFTLPYQTQQSIVKYFVAEMKNMLKIIEEA